MQYLIAMAKDYNVTYIKQKVGAHEWQKPVLYGQCEKNPNKCYYIFTRTRCLEPEMHIKFMSDLMNPRWHICFYRVK